jgi:hypothetical protein
LDSGLAARAVDDDVGPDLQLHVKRVAAARGPCSDPELEHVVAALQPVDVHEARVGRAAGPDIASSTSLPFKNVRMRSSMLEIRTRGGRRCRRRASGRSVDRRQHVGVVL